MTALFFARSRALRNDLSAMISNRLELLKLAATLGFLVLLLSCLQWGFQQMLGYLAAVPAVGLLMIQKLLDIALLSTFSLIALSSMVTSLSTHFDSSDLEILLSFPIPRLKIYLWKSLEAAVHAVWMVLLVLVPFLWVYARIKGLDAVFLLLAFVLFLPFAASAACVGISLSTLFVSVFPRRRLTEFLSVLGVLVFVLAYSGLRLALPKKFASPDQLQDVLEYILYLQSPVAPFLPSHWYVHCLNAYMSGNWPDLAQGAAMLLFFAASGGLLLVLLSSKVLTARKWAQVLEGAGGEGKMDESMVKAQRGKGTVSKPGQLPMRKGNSLKKLLLMKEWRFFFRDSQRFSNASFIVAVCVIYLVSIYRLPMDTNQLKNFLSFINLALGLFIIAALSLRFCYPQPSLELAYSWIVRTSPMKVSEFLGTKFIFNLIFLNLLGIVMVILSPMFLGADLRLIPIYLIAAFFCSNVLAALAIAIGSVFPKSNFENVIQIETSFGGFLYAVISLLFVGVTLSVFAWPIRYFFQTAYLGKPLDQNDWIWLGILGAAYTFLSAGLMIFSWRLANRAWTQAA